MLFGKTVADIVEGVTKLTRVQYSSLEDVQMENLRKMLLAMGVIIQNGGHKRKNVPRRGDLPSGETS